MEAQNMTKTTLIDTEIFVATPAECNEAYNSRQELRGRLYTEAESGLMLLLNPGNIARILADKKANHRMVVTKEYLKKLGL
jgi:hypothetical protein